MKKILTLILVCISLKIDNIFSCEEAFSPREYSSDELLDQPSLFLPAYIALFPELRREYEYLIEHGNISEEKRRQIKHHLKLADRMREK